MTRLVVALLLLLFTAQAALAQSATPTPAPTFTPTATPELAEKQTLQLGETSQDVVLLWTFTADQVAQALLLLAIWVALLIAFAVRLLNERGR